ncbi:MAG: glycosyltransferase, partial [Candidatus Eisenbacteria bacterium]
VELLPNAVMIPTLIPPPARPPFRWLHLARLGLAKGTWDLLDALRLLSDRGDWEAVLAGDGEVEEARRCAADLGPRVQVLGWQSGEAAVALLRSAHALVLPSHLEGLPMSVLEAMAAGRPVVTTPVGGLAALVEDGVQGRLIPVGDPRALADALRAMMAASLDPMASAARARVAERHDLARVAARLRDLYLDLAIPAQERRS